MEEDNILSRMTAPVAPSVVAALALKPEEPNSHDISSNVVRKLCKGHPIDLVEKNSELVADNAGLFQFGRGNLRNVDAGAVKQKNIARLKAAARRNSVRQMKKQGLPTVGIGSS